MNIARNNPGNIRTGKAVWQGQITPENGGDPVFVQFTTPEFGLRAMAVILRGYQHHHGLQTIRQFIQRWAPPSDDNDTEAYIADVAARTSILPDAAIDLSDEDGLALLIAAIVHHENGEQPYTTAQIDSAIAMA